MMSSDNLRFLAEAVAGTVIDSLWMFTVIAIVLAICLRLISTHRSNLRYGLGITALVACFTSAIFSFTNNLNLDGAHEEYTTLVITLQEQIAQVNESIWFDFQNLPYWIFAVWIMGFVLLSMRMIFLYVRIKRYTASRNIITNEGLQKQLSQLLQRIGISKKIGVFESQQINSPMVFGFLKPIILFPIGLLNQLTQDELEQILLHELAHVIRYDYIINLLQSLLEVLFYYHPAIWWISSQIRNERECACDQWALTYDHSAMSYVKLLVKLQEYALTPNTNLGLAFAGSSFSNRIKRILNMSITKNHFKERLSVVLVLLFSLVIYSFTLSEDRSKELRAPVIAKYDIFPVGCDTIPKSTEISRTIKKSITEEGGNIEIVQESNENDEEERLEVSVNGDGEIEEMKLNDKLIDEEDYDKYMDEIDFITKDKNGKYSSNSKIIIMDDEHEERMEEIMARVEASVEEWSESSEGLIDLALSFSDENHIEDIDFDSYRFPTQTEDGTLRITVGPNGKTMDIKIDEFNESMSIISDSMKIMNFDFNELRESMEDFEFDMEELSESFGDGNDVQIYRWKDHHDFDFPVPPSPPTPPSPPSIRFPDFNGFSFNATFTDKMGNMLNRDGLLEPGKNNEIELSGKHLKINGDKQPDNIHSKYKELYESYIGSELGKKSKIIIDVIGKKRSFRSI